MEPTLRHVDAVGPAKWYARAYAALATTRVARFISRHVNWKLDPLLLRITRGRVASTLMFPAALLETQGAKTGTRSRNAVIYFHDGDRVIIAASNAGSAHHPSWFHNLRADPDVLLGGVAMRAAMVQDKDERQRLWALADRVFPAFANYRNAAAATGRAIPLIQLMPRARNAPGPTN